MRPDPLGDAGPLLMSAKFARLECWDLERLWLGTSILLARPGGFFFLLSKRRKCPSQGRDCEEFKLMDDCNHGNAKQASRSCVNMGMLRFYWSQPIPLQIVSRQRT